MWSLMLMVGGRAAAFSFRVRWSADLGLGR